MRFLPKFKQIALICINKTHENFINDVYALNVTY